MLTKLPKSSPNTLKPSEYLTSRIESEKSLSINRRMQNIMPKIPLDFGDAPKLNFPLNSPRKYNSKSHRNPPKNREIFTFDNSSFSISEEEDSLEKSSNSVIKSSFFSSKNSKKSEEINTEKKLDKNIEKNGEKNFDKNSEKTQYAENLEKKLRDTKKTHLRATSEFFGKTSDSPPKKDEISFKTNKAIIDRKKLNPFTEKLYGLIGKFYVIKKFIKNLRNAANVRFPTKYQMNRMFVLNDRCFYQEGFIISQENDQKIKKPKKFMMLFMVLIQFLSKIYEFLTNNLNKYLKIFDPANTLRSLWDGLHLMVLFFYFFKIPVELSFEINLFEYLQGINENLAEFFNYFGVLFLLLDFLVNFNTGYYKKGSLIVKRENIAKHYIKSKFFFDIISFLPILLEFQKIEFDDKLKLLFFLRISNFFRIFSRIEESIHINFKLFNLLTLLKVVTRIILLSHLFACGWHYISFQNLTKTSETW